MTKEQQIKIQRCIDEFYSNRPQVRDELGAALQVLYEAEPVKHGRWLRTDAYPHRIYCSECYATFIRNDEFLKLNDIPHDYCPNCGAKMDLTE